MYFAYISMSGAPVEYATNLHHADSDESLYSGQVTLFNTNSRSY